MPSGDSPDGTGATVPGNKDRLLGTLRSAVPVGGSPTGAGESPVPPIFQTRFQESCPCCSPCAPPLAFAVGVSWHGPQHRCANPLHPRVRRCERGRVAAVPVRFGKPGGTIARVSPKAALCEEGVRWRMGRAQQRRFAKAGLGSPLDAGIHVA